MDKGQSKRIWAELYKVIDSSDVVIQARATLHLVSHWFVLKFRVQHHACTSFCSSA